MAIAIQFNFDLKCLLIEIKSIILLSTLKNCWLYNIAANNWSVSSHGQKAHEDFTGISYKNKVYLPDFSLPEVHDPLQNKWSSWPPTKINRLGGCCIVIWRESIILFGGSTLGDPRAPKAVEQFDFSNQSWKTLTLEAPFNMFLSACAVLPSEDILLFGDIDSSGNPTYIYSVLNNSWREIEKSSLTGGGSAMVVLGSRIFAIGGNGSPNAVQEFISSNETWVTLQTPVLQPRRSHGVIPVPAEMFSHLPGGCQGVL